MYLFPLLPKKPRNESERRRAGPLRLACLIAVPCAFGAVIPIGLSVRHNYPGVSDDAFAYGAVATLVILSFVIAAILFLIFLTWTDLRRTLKARSAAPGPANPRDPRAR